MMRICFIVLFVVQQNKLSPANIYIRSLTQHDFELKERTHTHMHKMREERKRESEEKP